MSFYRSAGAIPRKRHTQHRRADGGLYFEELMGEEGFSSDSSLLYHAFVPSGLVGSATRSPGSRRRSTGTQPATSASTSSRARPSWKQPAVTSTSVRATT